MNKIEHHWANRTLSLSKKVPNADSDIAKDCHSYLTVLGWKEVGTSKWKRNGGGPQSTEWMWHLQVKMKETEKYSTNCKVREARDCVWLCSPMYPWVRGCYNAWSGPAFRMEAYISPVCWEGWLLRVHSWVPSQALSFVEESSLLMVLSPLHFQPNGWSIQRYKGPGGLPPLRVILSSRTLGRTSWGLGSYCMTIQLFPNPAFLTH